MSYEIHKVKISNVKDYTFKYFVIFTKELKLVRSNLLSDYQNNSRVYSDTCPSDNKFTEPDDTFKHIYTRFLRRI